MRSPFQAIAWEICAKNRWALFFAFALIPFCFLLWLLAPSGHELVKGIQVFGAIATFTSLVWMFSYTANDPRGSFFGYPSWMYTLPLSTRALVISPMLLGAALMLGATVAWEATICVCWEIPFQLRYVSWHAALSVGALLSVQALIWSLHRFRWIRVLALVAAFYGFLYVALVGQTWGFPGGETVWLAGVALTLPVAIAGGIVGVERDRRGRWEGWTGKLLERLLDLIPRRSGSFKSVAHARFWLEWRRKGFFPALAFGVTVSLWAFTYPLSAALYLSPVETMMNFCGPFVGMVFFAGIIGNSIAKSDLWSRDLSFHSVAAVRPSSTVEIVFAKMKAALAAVLLGWTFFAILLIPVIAISGARDWPSEQAVRFWQDFSANYSRYWRWLSNPLVILALIAATWNTAIQAMAVVLTGNKRRILLNAWQGIAMMMSVGGCILWLVKYPLKVDVFLRVLPWLLTAMMVLKAYRTVRAFLRVKPLVSQRDLFILFALWCLVASLVLTAGFLAHFARGLPVSVLWTLVLWQFFPSGEIPQSVVALAANRHR